MSEIQGGGGGQKEGGAFLVEGYKFHHGIALFTGTLRTVPVAASLKRRLRGSRLSRDAATGNLQPLTGHCLVKDQVLRIEFFDSQHAIIHPQREIP